jgi:hypothetical protein
MNRVERLEGRTLFASYAAATVTELIAAIHAANASAADDTISLAVGATFTLTAVDNTTADEGPTGLPVVAAGGGDLTIVGNGATIERSAAAQTPAFRLLRADPNPMLILTDLTLQGGWATAEAGPARGGAVYYPEGGGQLFLENVIAQNNRAVGVDGSTGLEFDTAAQGAQGGGIYGGFFFARGCTFRDNLAQGGQGADGSLPTGGEARGGGIIGAGTMRNCVITGNIARGGNAGANGMGGGARGGGAYLYGYQVFDSTITHNAAIAGTGSTRKTAGSAFGGGVYASGRGVDFDSFTLRNTKRNTASSGSKDIAGIYYRIA